MNTQRNVQNLVVMALLIISGSAASNYSPEMAATLMQHYYPNMTTQAATAPVLQKEEPSASARTLVASEIEAIEAIMNFEEPRIAVKPPQKNERATKPVKQKLASKPEYVVFEKQPFGKKLLDKTRAILNKPGLQLAAVAASAGAYALAKVTKSALAEHADKTGTDKIKAIYGSLKTLGLGKFLASTKSSFAQDASLKQALAFVAVDTLLELSTKGLSKLTQLA